MNARLRSALRSGLAGNLLFVLFGFICYIYYITHLMQSVKDNCVRNRFFLKHGLPSFADHVFLLIMYITDHVFLLIKPGRIFSEPPGLSLCL